MRKRLDDPARVRRAQRKVAIDRVQHVRLFALEAAQDRVDEAGRFFETEHPRGADRLRHGGVRRRLARDQLLQPDLEQRAQARLQLVG